MDNVDALIEPVIRIAQQAGAEILDIYSRSHQFKVQAKKDHSPLTQADLSAHELIWRELSQLTPDIPISSEEGPQVDFAERQHWPYYWCVDPLDGTREFIRHSGEFTVNIALIHQHQPILGVIYVPVLDESYYASQHQPARKRAPNAPDRSIHVRPWRFNQTEILASRGVNENRMQLRAHSLGQFHLQKFSSAWKFGLIAEGNADLYPRLGDTYEWDTAAGQCILEQAGGMIIDSNGQALRYNTQESLLNTHFLALGDHQAILQKLVIAEMLSP